MKIYKARKQPVRESSLLKSSDYILMENTITDDQVLIALLGKDFLFDAVNLAIQAFGWGVFVAGFGVAIQLMLAKARTRSLTVLSICLVVIFIAFVCEYVLLTGTILSEVSELFIATSQDELQARLDANDASLIRWEYFFSWPDNVNLLLSDAIVAWRAWVLSEKKIWRIILAALMIVNIGFNVADCIFQDIEIKQEVDGSSIVDWMSTAFSLAVNVCATSLIAWKYWNYLHFMKKHWQKAKGTKKSHVQDILLLLIESGVIFCGIQLTCVITVILRTIREQDLNISIADGVATTVLSVITAWYPVAVVILVSKDYLVGVETFHHVAGSQMANDFTPSA
ncbi:hypothetical protein GYMLUDRAFT_241979 [Collybiopsis luxurians FD-317 M1]|uniref:Uncharacterized protein n=1 Tax=Collybiopsis luxurians FD-317 M1 TaxID=944289 RepID=A0A0D0CKU9_9AGAR|nr:hypothetical protein GYMLUDRAFT_241979 [Collybiopsis luxurians FD-317 M1]